jgi:hypothetical protein
LAGLGLLHGLDGEEVTRSRALLETFGVLDREPTGWSIKHFVPIDDEVPPAEVMAAIGRALGRPLDAGAPVPTPQAVVPLESARTRMARRWMAAPIGAAAAAAVVLVALLVSGQVRVPLTSQPASNSSQTAVGAGAGATTTVPGAPQSSSVPGSLPSAGPAGASSPATGQPPATVSAAGAPTQLVCPVGVVSASVDHISQAVDGSVPSSINVDLQPVVHTSVTGTLRNESPNAVMVDPFPVRVNFTDPAAGASQSVTTTALTGSTPVASGAQLPWSVTVENPRHAPVPATADAGQPTWRWADPTLAVTCTH